MRQMCNTCRISTLCLPRGMKEFAEHCFRCPLCRGIWLEYPGGERLLAEAGELCYDFERHVTLTMRSGVMCDNCQSAALAVK